jgi:uncharacterized protein (DUF433 family)
MDEAPEIHIVITPRAQAALDELQAMIAAHFPEATFDTYKGHEPAGIYLEATVDVDDLDVVKDVFLDRLVDIQVDDGIPVYVSLTRPRARVLAEFRAQRERSDPHPVSDRIVQDPAIRGGQPLVAGTHIPVALVFAFLSHTPEVDTLLTEYPELTIDDVRACFAYAQSLAAKAPRREELALPGSRLDASA